jgi:hypothetical protein
MRTVRSRWVVCLIAVAVLGAACTSGAAVSTTTSSPVTSTTNPTHPTPTTAVDLAATPTGWVSVAYRDAQLSVPSDWVALYHEPPCVIGHPPGEVFDNPLSGTFSCPAETAPEPSTFVELDALSRTARRGSVMTINGIVVRRAVRPPHTYLVPSLGVQITVSGRLASRVLRTLTRSPRAVALGSGTPPSVPPGWHNVTFRGMSFEVPRSWPVGRTAVAGRDVAQPCSASGVAFAEPEVALSTDRQRFPVAYCPVLPPPRPLPPTDGVEVDAGSITQFPVALSFSRHCLHFDGLSACPASTPAYSILILRVALQGRRTPLLVSIGLAGSGIVARTILYSLRAA